MGTQEGNLFWHWHQATLQLKVFLVQISLYEKSKESVPSSQVTNMIKLLELSLLYKLLDWFPFFSLLHSLKYGMHDVRKYQQISICTMLQDVQCHHVQGRNLNLNVVKHYLVGHSVKLKLSIVIIKLFFQEKIWYHQ